MQVDYLSDVHVSHHVPFGHNQEKWERKTKEWTENLYKNANGEVLVVAGDMSEWNQQTVWFFEKSCKYYERVYFVVGNHDYYLLTNNQRKKYGNSIDKVVELLKSLSHIEHLVPLHKTVDTYKGVTFAGHSMWYDLPTDKDFAWHNTYSNDSKFIYGLSPGNDAYKELQKDSLEWYETLETDKIDVFVSHFPPFNPPFSTYKHNANYVSEVPFVVGKHWVSGHQHLVGEHERFGVKFYMNTIGYPNENHKLSVRTFSVN